MSREEEQMLKLGRMVVRMIHDVRKTSAEAASYATHEVTFPGGSVHLVVCSDRDLLAAMERGAAKKFDVGEMTPPSAVN